ncbi:MAG: oxaloacetate decarboxylase [Deltaproteobacteria bacterium]|nr:oxaloacetate decarboxylase [Deltaproteobacteria bacterium]
MKRTTQLRRLLENPQILVAPGCHDALGARFIQRAGFSVAYVTGYGVACSLLGRPDVGEITQTEMVAHAARIAAAIDIPLLCDADTGYGGPLNVQRTVREFQRAGVAGIHIEDQQEPKRCAAMGGVRVTDLPTAVARVRAAVEAKSDPDFLVIARTDCRPSLGVDAAIERARAFADAGADMIYVELLGSRDEVARVAREAGSTPLLFDMFDHPKVPVLSAAELEEMGYRVVTFPFTSTLAYAKVLADIYPSILRTGGASEVADRRMELHAFEEAMGLAEIWRGVEKLQGAAAEAGRPGSEGTPG